MSEDSKLKEVQAFVTNLITTLKSVVAGGDAHSSSDRFFPKGINLISADVVDGSTTLHLRIGTGEVEDVRDTSMPVLPDRLVLPMYIEYPGYTRVSNVNVVIQVAFVAGPTKTIKFTNVQSGKTSIYLDGPIDVTG